MQEISLKIKANLDPSSLKRSTEELLNQLKDVQLEGLFFPKESVEYIDKITKDFENLNQSFEKLIRNIGQFNDRLTQNVRLQNQYQNRSQIHFNRHYYGGGIRGYVSQYLHQKFGPIGEFLDNVFEPVLSVASGYGIYRLAHAGADLIKTEDQYVVDLATRMGTYGTNFRRARLDFNAIGAPYNFTGLETMQIANTYMSIAGTANLRKQLSDILFASKAFGLDSQYLAGAYGQFAKMGARDLRALSEAFAGAIKMTGMQGREQELIDALNRLTQTAYQHELSISSKEQKTMLGWLTFFGKTEPALRGEKGAQLYAGLEGMIQGVADNPELMAIMGYGTRYTGTKGYWELRMRTSHGLRDKRNLQDLMKGLDQWIGDPYLKRIYLDQLLRQYGVDSPEIVEYLLRPDIHQKIVTGKGLDEVIKQIDQMGRKDLQQKFATRMQSPAEQDKAWNVYWQQVQKTLGEPLLDLERSFKSTVMDLFSPEALAWTLFAGGMFSGSMLRRLLRYGFGRFFRGGMGGRSASGGRLLGSLGEALGEFGSTVGKAIEGAGKFLEGLVKYLPPVFPAFKAIFDDNTMAKGDNRLMLTSALGLSHYSTMTLPAYGLSHYRVRTLEARREDLINKEMNLLNKKESVLRMEQGGLTSVASRGNNFDLERIFSNLSANTREMLKQVSHDMITFLSASGYGSSDSSDGLTPKPVSNTMNLKDGFNMPASEIDAWINKYAPPGSVMRGMGQAFHVAAAKTGLDVRYLVAHAAQETGWGTSHIAQSKYNFYGINAVDWNPYGGAYRFSSPAEGIIKGAEWIAKNYVNRGQNTLYSMNHNAGGHEYSSDKTWDESIAKIMSTAPKGPTATLNVNVSVNGNVQGLTPVDTSAVTQAIVRKINSAPDLSYIFRQGVRGVAW